MNATEQKTQTWWRVSTYFDLGKIEEREVVRVTPSFVVYLRPNMGGQLVEQREGKDTEYYRWLPTEAEAVSHARSLLVSRRDRLWNQYSIAESALAAFNAEHPED